MAKKTTDQCAKLGKLQHTKDYYQSQPVGQNLYLSSWAPSAADVLQTKTLEPNPTIADIKIETYFFVFLTIKNFLPYICIFYSIS